MINRFQFCINNTHRSDQYTLIAIILYQDVPRQKFARRKLYPNTGHFKMILIIYAYTIYSN